MSVCSPVAGRSPHWHAHCSRSQWQESGWEHASARMEGLSTNRQPWWSWPVTEGRTWLCLQTAVTGRRGGKLAAYAFTWGCRLFPLSIISESSQYKKTKKKKKLKKHTDWKENQSLGIDNMILYAENPKESTKNLVRLKNMRSIYKKQLYSYKLRGDNPTMTLRNQFYSPQHKK